MKPGGFVRGLLIKDGPRMPSQAFERWRMDRMAALDEIERAHRGMGGIGPGSRTTTRQLNQAYVLLLSSQFQGFCRDLHTECVRAISRILPTAELQTLMREGLLMGRKLDTGNPNPGNIGADFNRFNLPFWALVEAAPPRNARRKTLLEQMNRWRNAISHNAFDTGMLRSGHPVLALAEVRRWRKACDAWRSCSTGS